VIDIGTRYTAMMDYKAEWRLRTREWAVTLLGSACGNCGSTQDLQFDHTDAASKSFEISAGIRDGYSRERLAAELAKCQLLCLPHHMEKSYASGDLKTVPHGGGRTGKHGCKCDPCRLRKNEYLRELKRARRAAARQ
jgi:hypothetical protein